MSDWTAQAAERQQVRRRAQGIRPKAVVPVRDRFAAKVEQEAGGCWRWTGFRDKAGYARLHEAGRGSPVLYAHRLAYELHRGQVPDGAELDHLCRNRWCVNPWHLEAVSHRENVLRGAAPTVVAYVSG